VNGRDVVRSRFYRGSSMWPAFRPGDWLVVESVPHEKIRRGDIIVFQATNIEAEISDSKGSITPDSELSEVPHSRNYLKNPPIETPDAESRLLVHRVIAVRPGGLVTRGDNNPAFDNDLVSPERLIGRAVAFERRRRKVRVSGGTGGFVLASARRFFRRVARSFFRVVRFPLRPAYRLLRRSGIIGAIWKPRLTAVQFRSPSGPFVKYVRGSRTVAMWWPERRSFRCRRPYDLIIRPPVSS
jgi:signal peptidase I